MSLISNHQNKYILGNVVAQRDRLSEIFLNNIICPFDGTEILYMFSELESIFNNANLENSLNTRQKLMLEAMRNKKLQLGIQLHFEID